jgi:hypothetical protein
MQPVTGGVLRGEGSRFQLFGDSMNTASRIETSGLPNKIHLSPTTAQLLKETGKEKWLKERENVVSLKGKGEMQTYWLKTGRAHGQDQSRSRNDGERAYLDDGDDDSDASDSDSDESYSSSYEESLNLEEDLIQSMVSEKTARLIEWNVEVLQRLLKQIVARRPSGEVNAKSHHWKSVGTKSENILEEAREAICLPPFDPTVSALSEAEIDAVQLDPEIVAQLKDLITNLAIMHRDNPYHNFEHASHASLLASKFLSRIATHCRESAGDGSPIRLKSMHERAYRVAADPSTQFAILFASLIPSIDHPGVPNARAAKERKEMARALGGTSVTEANAFLLAWDLLLDADFRELRHAIASTKEEARRFRQIVVTSVMSTDASDPSLRSAREERWSRAFSSKMGGAISRDSDRGSIHYNEQVTLVVELLAQSADASHAMQHHQVHNKWNERLFLEAFKAYRAGRAELNPTEHWYEDHLAFFDDVVVPAATKIQKLGILGVTAGDEILDKAAKNRYLWKANGQGAVKELAEQAERLYPVKQATPPVRAETAAPAATSRAAAAASAVASSAPATLKIGDNDVTAESVTSALSLLMLKVQGMVQQEEALMANQQGGGKGGGSSREGAPRASSTAASKNCSHATTTDGSQSQTADRGRSGGESLTVSRIDATPPVSMGIQALGTDRARYHFT